MFINDNPHNHHQDYYESNDKKYYKNNNFIIYSSIFLLFCVLSTFIFIFYKKNKQQLASEKLENSTSTIINKLPIDSIEDKKADNINDLLNGNQTEKFLFGDFYEKVERYVSSSSVVSYELPINVKVDVANYYEISRKINLDNYINDINKNGFAVLDQNIGLEMKEVDNFFDANRILIKNNIPVALTSDFILYYQQNVFKEIYKDIQKSSFYENVWNLSRKMYDISLKRYNLMLSQKKLENDPVLEGARLEVAFFATTLKILEPISTQIELDANLKNLNKFTEIETKKYSFYLPANLKDDVEKEIAFIRLAKQEDKSPVMRYPVDYTKYIVPLDYQENAKLNNFYLAMRWMNSVFPLNYKSETCEQCLLDKEDWLINLIASSFITKDFIDNQEVKNQWSIIYKFISFFGGTRNDLTYLHYNQNLIDLFGENYEIENIFAKENENKESNINELQKKLLANEFLAIDGGFDRNDENNKPLIGMRILQETYWPNEYILKQLAGKEIISNFEEDYYSKNKEKIKTACRGNFGRNEENFRKMYRCKASAFDLINIFHPIKKEANDYLSLNLDYTGYNEQINIFKNDFEKFNKYTWNSNIYWMLMDLQDTLFNYNEKNSPIFYLNDDWETKRTYNTILGAWVNFHLESDIYDNYNKGSNGLDYLDCNNYNYIEPNIDLINELIARNKMLLEILNLLNINKDTNVAGLRIKQLNKELDYLAKIVKKELSSQIMDEQDCIFLNDFLQAYVVKNEKNNSIKGNDYLLNNSIEGMKFSLIVYNYNNKKIIAVGPIFNYYEY